MNEPVLSIVTPTFNRAGFISHAIESVLQQDYPFVEHLVMDGGSSDGTLELLRKYPHLRTYSEPDAGLYDAVNKGIQAARGEVIGWLNSDDVYVPNVFGKVMHLFQRHPEAWAISAGVETIDQAGLVLRRLAPIHMDTIVHRVARKITPATNSWFFRRRLFDEIGFFDLQYAITADRDLFIRLACSNLKFLSLDEVVQQVVAHPGSLTRSGYRTAERSLGSLSLSTNYLNSSDTPPQVKLALLGWEHAFFTRIIQYHLQAGEPLHALRFFRLAHSRQPGWFLLRSRRFLSENWRLLRKQASSAQKKWRKFRKTILPRGSRRRRKK